MFDLASIDQVLNENREANNFSFPIESLNDALIYFKEHHGFIFLIDYHIKKIETDQFSLKLILKNLEKKATIIVEASFSKGEEVPSFAHLWQGATSLERMYKNKLGISRMSEDLSSKEISEKKVIELDFDISHSFPEISYMDNEEKVTQVFIKNLDLKNSNKPTAFHSLKHLKEVSAYNPKDVIHCEIAYCMAVEESLGIKIPEKAQALRMIMSELQRIIDHFDYCIQTFISLKEFQEIELIINLRRKTLDLFLFYCHDDLAPRFNTIGGCSYDLPLGWIPMASDTLRFIEKECVALFKGKLRSSLWVEGFSHHKVSGSELLSWCLSGPNLRASGINFDLRKNEPHYFYSELDFEVPVGIFGTSYDRLLVRVEEIYASIKIVLQVLDNLPYGEICSLEEFLLPNLKKKLQDKENQKKYKEIITQGHELKKGNWISMLETARGINGFYLEVNELGSHIHYLNSQYSSLFSLEKTLRGLERSSLSQVIQSFGAHPWELEIK